MSRPLDDFSKDTATRAKAGIEAVKTAFAMSGHPFFFFGSLGLNTETALGPSLRCIDGATRPSYQVRTCLLLDYMTLSRIDSIIFSTASIPHIHRPKPAHQQLPYHILNDPNQLINIRTPYNNGSNRGTTWSNTCGSLWVRIPSFPNCRYRLSRPFYLERFCTHRPRYPG